MNQFHSQVMNAMAGMLSKAKKTITREEYEYFKHEFVFDKLRGLTLGQAFCEKFEISDYMLSNIKSDEEAIFLIENLGYIK
jgi:hypothetical protein